MQKSSIFSLCYNSYLRRFSIHHFYEDNASVQRKNVQFAGRQLASIKQPRTKQLTVNLRPEVHRRLKSLLE